MITDPVTQMSPPRRFLTISTYIQPKETSSLVIIPARHRTTAAELICSLPTLLSRNNQSESFALRYLPKQSPLRKQDSVVYKDIVLLP